MEISCGLVKVKLKCKPKIVILSTVVKMGNGQGQSPVLRVTASEVRLYGSKILNLLGVVTD